jgi:CTP synthase (UTP-ammonia lyase)
VVVSVLIDLPPAHRYHQATLEAIRHASDQLAIPTEIRVVPTDSIPPLEQVVSRGSAVVVGPGSPYSDQDAVHSCIAAARENGVPLVGT